MCMAEAGITDAAAAGPTSYSRRLLDGPSKSGSRVR